MLSLRDLERVEITAESVGAPLVVNNACWHGWRAEIDGRSTPSYSVAALLGTVP